MAIFADRTAAGRELAGALEGWRDTDAVVFGIPRGGVVVAAQVARLIGRPLDVAVVRKLGAPSHEEFAIGAIAAGVRVVDAAAVRAGRVSPEQLAVVEARERVELDRRLSAFPRSNSTISGRTAIVVDDGLATGATATAACRALHAENPSRVVLAVPVAPVHWEPDSQLIDEFMCPHRMRDFWAVGQYYEDFTQTSDEEVARLLTQDPLD